jgi:uncharacterized protein YbjT (DUF2867 family)
MKVLVTGASGFVGRAVVAALAADGDEVHAAVRHAPAVPFPHGVAVVRHGDLAEPVDWAPLLTGIDVVVHLAGIAHTALALSAPALPGSATTSSIIVPRPRSPPRHVLRAWHAWSSFRRSAPRLALPRTAS